MINEGREDSSSWCLICPRETTPQKPSPLVASTGVRRLDYVTNDLSTGQEKPNSLMRVPERPTGRTMPESILPLDLSGKRTQTPPGRTCTDRQGCTHCIAPQDTCIPPLAYRCTFKTTFLATDCSVPASLLRVVSSFGLRNQVRYPSGEWSATKSPALPWSGVAATVLSKPAARTYRASGQTPRPELAQRGVSASVTRSP